MNIFHLLIGCGFLELVIAVVLSNNGEEQSDDVIDIVDQIMTDAVQETVSAMEVTRTYTPHKCCKIGTHAAARGLDCSIDLNQIQNRMNNAVYRSEIKSPDLSAASLSRNIVYKALFMRIEKMLSKEKVQVHVRQVL